MMSSVEETRVGLSSLSFRVLQAPPDEVSPAAAASAVRRFLERKRPGLAQALEIEAAPGGVMLRARGEAPGAMLHEALDLLESTRPPVAEREIEVDPEEFAIETAEGVADVLHEREVLRSRVRYFPYPICEWFEISTGELALSDHRVTYEPEWQIMQDEAAHASGQHLIPLNSVDRVERGEWWDVPCLMIYTPRTTYRYGWPAERRDIELLFDVDEWLLRIRQLLERQ